MSQEKINAFLLDLKEICTKHGMQICNVYDEPVHLIDNEREQISEDIDFEEYKAAEYIERIYEPDPNAKPMSLNEASVMMKEFYADKIKDTLSNDHVLLKLMKRE